MRPSVASRTRLSGSGRSSEITRKLSIRSAMALVRTSGTRAGGSQSQTWPSSVWPDMYSSSWMCPIGKS